jgi:hypothetical protein
MRNDPGERAVALMDKLLAERPDKVGPDFSEATRCITAYREELIGRYRAGALPRGRLDDINAVLSVVVAGHFPLGGIPWDKIAMARERLVTLLSNAMTSATDDRA